MTRREFSTKVMLAAYERSRGLCEECGAILQVGKFDYDHDVPDALGGEPTLENCKVRCRFCHSRKTARVDVPQIAKANRQRVRYLGAKSRKPQSKFKRLASGRVVLRKCVECGIYPADLPRGICPGCEAYKEHQR